MRVFKNDRATSTFVTPRALKCDIPVQFQVGDVVEFRGSEKDVASLLVRIEYAESGQQVDLRVPRSMSAKVREARTSVVNCLRKARAEVDVVSQNLKSAQLTKFEGDVKETYAKLHLLLQTVLDETAARGVQG